MKELDDLIGRAENPTNTFGIGAFKKEIVTVALCLKEAMEALEKYKTQSSSAQTLEMAAADALTKIKEALEGLR